jgi:hypothetical protein
VVDVRWRVNLTLGAALAELQELFALSPESGSGFTRMFLKYVLASG